MTEDLVREYYQRAINDEIQEHVHPFYALPPKKFEARVFEFIKELFSDGSIWEEECLDSEGPDISQLIALAEESAKKLCYLHRTIKTVHAEYMERMKMLDKELEEAKFFPEASLIMGEGAYWSPDC